MKYAICSNSRSGNYIASDDIHRFIIMVIVILIVAITTAAAVVLVVTI